MARPGDRAGAGGGAVLRPGSAGLGAGPGPARTAGRRTTRSIGPGPGRKDIRDLLAIADAADARGYRFDRTRVVLPPGPERLPLTDGQLALEWAHLRAKVIERDPPWLDRLVAPRPHPMFDLIPGPVAAWERAGLPEE